MDFDLIAFDLDGTVFPDSGERRVSPRVVSALTAARERGACIVVASGRPVGMMGEQVLGLPCLDWCISLNGARVTDVHGERELVSRPMPRETALAILDAPISERVAWSLFTDEGAYFELSKRMEAGERAGEKSGDDSFASGSLKVSRMNTTGLTFVDSALDVLRASTGKVYKFGGSCADAATLGELEAYLATFPGLEVARMVGGELEVTMAGVNKGSALAALCRELSLDEHRAVAFGDSGNDITFADGACTFVAMGNASEDIKAAANDVCPSVDDDGVAVWLEEHMR